MDGEHSPVDSRRLHSLAEKFHDKQYRDGYVEALTRRVLAEQMRAFRDELSQVEYAAKIGKQKTVVGRLENPAYGGWSLRTMHEVARKENVAVIARFVDYQTFLKLTNDMSDAAIRPEPYDQNKIDDLAKSAGVFESTARLLKQWKLEGTANYLNNSLTLGALTRAQVAHTPMLLEALAEEWNKEIEMATLKKTIEEKNKLIQRLLTASLLSAPAKQDIAPEAAAVEEGKPLEPAMLGFAA